MSANPSTESRPSRPVLKNTYGRKPSTDPSLETSEEVPTTASALPSRLPIIGDDEEEDGDDFYSDLAMSRSLLAPKSYLNASAPQNSDATQLISYPDEMMDIDEDKTQENLETPLTPRSKLKAMLASLEREQDRSSMEPKAKSISTNPFTLIGDDEDEEEENDEDFMSRFRNQFLSKQAPASESASSESSAPVTEIQKEVPARVTTPTRLSPEVQEPSPVIHKPLPVLQRDLDEISDEDEHITDLSDNEDYLFVNTSAPRSQAPKVVDAEDDNGMEVETEGQSVMELEPELPVSSTPAAKPKKVSLLSLYLGCYVVHFD